MHPQHWLDRREQRKTGFHQDRINAHLETFWPTSGIAPLCPVGY